MSDLSVHFSLAELTASSTARARGIVNDPPPEIYARLQQTAQAMETVRVLLGDRPIRISSGYRSPQLNRAIGGSATSAHCLGYAVDFTCPEFGSPYDVCQKILGSGVAFDQLIHEYGSWTHISVDPRGRQQPLTIANARRGYMAGILRIS